MDIVYSMCTMYMYVIEFTTTVYIVALHSVLTNDEIRANFACALMQHFRLTHILENGCNEILTSFRTIGRNRKKNLRIMLHAFDDR